MTEVAPLSALPLTQLPEPLFEMQPAVPAFWVRVPSVARSKTATAALVAGGDVDAGSVRRDGDRGRGVKRLAGVVAAGDRGGGFVDDAAVGVGFLGQITGCRKRHRGNDCQREGACSRCNDKARGPASRAERSYALAPDRS